MPNRVAVQNAIVAVLNAVESVEHIETGWPRIDGREDLVSRYRMQDKRTSQMWLVRRTRSDPESSESMRGEVPIGTALFWYHTFEVSYWIGFIPGVTEEIFQDTIDDVLDAFKEKRTLGAFQADKPLGLKGTAPRALHGVYGFAATFEITVMEWETGLDPE
jgi:hypothetical protein